MKRRVVVTGLGVLTSNAEGVTAFAEALKTGRSGISPISQFDTGPYPCKISGEIKALPLDPDPVEPLDRASVLALRAATLAFQDAAIDPRALPAGELGASVGTTCGGVLSLEKVSEVLESGGDLSELPDWRIKELSFFAPTNQVARRFQVTGPVVTVTVACASGAHSVGVGTDLIQAGQAELMLAGGVDVISRFIYRGFAALNGLGAPPYRAFDKNRNGVVLGEGAGFLVLEELEHARARGAHIYGEILGHSFNNDGCHIVNPNPTGEGIARSFRMALRDAGLEPADVHHLNAHGTGTMANDSAETAGVKLVFGEYAAELPVASIKPMLGHTSGAAGSIELIAAILSLNDSFVPPTINFETVDPACDLNLSADLRSAPLRHVMSANSGFGGSNAAVIVGRAEEQEGRTARAVSNSGKRDEQRGDLEDAHRVVISGVGALLPGIDSLEAFWSRLQGPETRGNPEQGGLEIPPFDFFARAQMAPSKDARRMDLFSQYAVMGGFLALQDAGLSLDPPDEQLGVVLGSAYACLESNEKFSSGLTKTKVNPVIYQNTVSNASSGYMCMLLGIRGPVSVLNQGWLAGSAALAYGYELVRSGRCRAVLAGGAERLCRMTLLSLERAGVLSRERCGRPFAESSDGLLPTDGAAFAVLETLASARARGARIYGELTGYGFSNAADGAPVDAVARATARALRSLPERVRAPHIYASANGVARIDRWESQGIEKALSRLERHATVSSIKGAVGEALGAGGPLSLVAGALSLSRQELVGPVSSGAGLASDQLDLLTGLQSGPVSGVVISSTDEDGSCVSLALSAMVDG